MVTRTAAWPAGVPCWTSLTAPDVEAAKAFYAAVLGWEFVQYGAEYGGNALARVAGRSAAGIGPVLDGGSPAWTLHLASDDVDATAAAIRDAGGAVLVEPADLGPLGRTCVAEDPTGTPFAVWQAGLLNGAEVVNEPGGLVWEDLRSPDPDAARAFYRTVFGYRTQPLEMAGPSYHTFHLAADSPPLGGMGDFMGEEGATPYWLVYFQTADTDAAAAAALAHGGAVVVQPFDSPFGRMAGLTDPGGAKLFVLQAVDGAPTPDWDE